MKTILEQVSDWAQAQQVVLTKIDERISFTVNAQGDSFPMVCLSLEEERVFVCLCGYGLCVDEARRAQVAAEIVALNFTLKWGAFQLDASNGELTFRATQLIPTDDAQAREMIEKSITYTAQMLMLSRDTVKGWLL